MIGYGRVGSYQLIIGYVELFVCWAILPLQDISVGNSNLRGTVVIFYTGVYITTHYCFDICASCDYITALAFAICPIRPQFPRVSGSCSVLVIVIIVYFVSFVCLLSLGTVSRCVSRWHFMTDLFIVNMCRFVQCLAQYMPCIISCEGS